MNDRIPTKGVEDDIFSKWRHSLCWKRGTAKKIKQGYSRRRRRVQKVDLKKAS